MASWDVRKLDNVAQRNVQVSELSFAIQNPQPSNLGSRLLIDVGTFPVGSPDASLVIKLGQTAELDALLTYPKQDGAYQIALTTGMLTLPPSGSWVMPAVSEVPATVTIRCRWGADHTRSRSPTSLMGRSLAAWCSSFRDLIS